MLEAAAAAAPPSIAGLADASFSLVWDGAAFTPGDARREVVGRDHGRRDDEEDERLWEGR